VLSFFKKINMSKKTGKILKCKICKKEVYVPGKRLDTFRYCSYKCAGIARRGIVPKNAFKSGEKRIIGKNSYIWKGEKASYVAIHRWVKKWFGKPDHCEHCGAIDKRKYNWANISGKYHRVRDDWKQLCIPCHRKFDHHGEKSRITWHKNNDKKK